MPEARGDGDVAPAPRGEGTDSVPVRDGDDDDNEMYEAAAEDSAYGTGSSGPNFSCMEDDNPCPRRNA